MAIMVLPTWLGRVGRPEALGGLGVCLGVATSALVAKPGESGALESDEFEEVFTDVAIGLELSDVRFLVFHQHCFLGDGQNKVHLLFPWPKHGATHKTKSTDPQSCHLIGQHTTVPARGRNLGGCTLPWLLRSRFTLLWPESGGLSPPTGTHEAWSATTTNTHERTTKALYSPQRS